jgi:uncharacterized membrane protein YdjX (TVP38/TMEM64 family)
MLFFIAIIIGAIIIAPFIVNLVKHPTDVREYMLSIGIWGGLLFLLIQLIHVIIAVIPGDFLYVLGGFVFGMPVGFLLSYFGVMIGTVIVFYLARSLGYDFVNKFVPKDKLHKASHILNSAKGLFGLFVICLIPIIPKDPLMYAAGLTPIKASRMFPVYALSRIPVTFVWVSIGANVYEKNFLGTVIVVTILLLLAVLGIILKKNIIKKEIKEVIN